MIHVGIWTTDFCVFHNRTICILSASFRSTAKKGVLLELIYPLIATSALSVGFWTSPSFDVLIKRGTTTTLQSYLTIFVDQCCGAHNVQTKKATHF